MGWGFLTRGATFLTSRLLFRIHPVGFFHFPVGAALVMPYFRDVGHGWESSSEGIGMLVSGTFFFTS